MSRFRAGLAAATVDLNSMVAAACVAVVAVVAMQVGLVGSAGSAGPAGADPGQPALPTPAEAAVCEQAWLLAFNSKKYVGNPRYGFGALAYFAWARTHCAGPDATFPNGTPVAGSGLGPDVPAWERLPTPGMPVPTEGAGR